MKLLLVLALLPPFLWAAQTDKEKGPGLEIGLISENASVSPGQDFVIGLHLQHHPGFHTYWRNPGMVGMETSLDWDLPEGFTASEIRWPHPENTFMAEYPCHGYDRDVTLLVTITPPARLEADQITLSAEAAWMCCAKGCYPGFQKLSLTLPVTPTPKPDPKARALIEKARKELPATDHQVTATLQSKVDAPQIEITLSGSRSWPKNELYFFSQDKQISSEHRQKFIPQPNGSLLLKIPRSEFSPEQKTTIPGVLKMGSRFLAIEARPKS